MKTSLSALAKPRRAGIALAWMTAALSVISPNGNCSEEQVSTPRPLTEGAASNPAEEAKASNELLFRLANESNGPDGVFGPITYGFRGSHTFSTGTSIEAGYIRLHEPGRAVLEAFLDEGQVTLKLPEQTLLSQPLIFGVTAWSNRMIDMYTNVGGLEITRSGPVSLTAGVYFGSATLEELSNRFVGFQLIASGSLGPVELSLGHMNGRMGNGYYRKSAAEVALGLFPKCPLPLNWSFSFEDRYYNFGDGGPVSNRDDELILITGLEIHLGKVLFGAE